MLACAAVTVALAAAPAWAQDSASCAATDDPTAPRTPTAGAPCWTEVEPYPFGADGGPVDVTAPECRPASPPGPTYSGDQLSCYLRADSLAFRAWNRGLAATSRALGAADATTPFGVWLFNGTRWFPDPTFPGPSVCRGNTVLWAGKLDYWLVGARLGEERWPSLCRFDGVNFEWQPLDVPRATLDRVPLEGVEGAMTRRPGALRTGACPRWDDCWFFGDYGVAVRWDGTELKDASPDLAVQPWLRSDFRAAALRPGPLGVGSVFAVGSSGGVGAGTQLPPKPDGTPPPQLFEGREGVPSPLAFSPPTAPRRDDPYRTDLAAITFDDQGRGWIAGNPAGERLTPAGRGGTVGTRRATSPEPSPLVRLASDGRAETCDAVPAGRFKFPAGPALGGENGVLWSSIAVAPTASARVVAGGQLDPAAPGLNVNDDGSPEPLVAQISCDGPSLQTRFRIPDPFVADQSKASSVPAGRGAFVTSVAANATNDAWAATSAGQLDRRPAFPNQRPHLYRLRDTEPPDGPSGDDVEPRPLVFQADPPIFVELPPDPEPPAPPDTTVIRPAAPLTPAVALKPAIYGVRSKVVTSKRRTYTLVVTFKVRRPVTIGVEALRRNKVVSRSGQKRFGRPAGKLVLRLQRRRWPTRIRFVSPIAGVSAPAPAGAPATSANPPK